MYILDRVIVGVNCFKKQNFRKSMQDRLYIKQ